MVREKMKGHQGNQQKHWRLHKILKTNHSFHVSFKDVLMGIPNSDLLGVTMAVIHVAGQRFLAVLYNKVVLCQFWQGNWPYNCEIRVS